MDDQEKLVQAMGDLDEEGVVAAVNGLLTRGVEPLSIVDLCRTGFEIVGKRYQNREYFLSGLIISDDIFKSVMNILDLTGCFDPTQEKRLGKVVLGAPLGDVHDIGKGIVGKLLQYSGFEVIDIGVNVRPAGFLEAVVENDANVVGISTLITMAYESLRETVLEFERAGLRDKIKVMLGGGAVSQRVSEYAGADAWSRDASDAVKFAKMFAGRE
jgi:methylmalonyl-CoA mutase cobalamin-binding domain/chain